MLQSKFAAWVDIFGLKSPKTKSKAAKKLAVLIVLALMPMTLQAEVWSRSLGTAWAGLTLRLINADYALFGDKTGLSASGDVRASILKQSVPLVEGWARAATQDKSYCEKVAERNPNSSCANWKRQVELGYFQKKYSSLYGYRIPRGINWQKATFYVNYGYRVFGITLKNMSEYGNELYEKVRGYEVPRFRVSDLKLPGPPAPPAKTERGSWARRNFSKYIPVGPFGFINVGAGYLISPGFTYGAKLNFDKSQIRNVSTLRNAVQKIVIEGKVRPSISASVNAYGRYDAYVLRGGLKGNLMVFAGGLEGLATYTQATRRFILKYRTFYRYLGGSITAYAQHVRGFSCRRHRWHFHCGRKWRTFWSKVLYRRAATARYYPWRTIYNKVVNW